MKTIFKVVILLATIVSCIFILGREKNVFADNAVCPPARPVCWSTRDLTEWACDYCPSYHWKCANGVDPPGPACSGPLADCSAYSGVCLYLCDDTSWTPGKCNPFFDKDVSCNISPGHCEWTGPLQDCGWVGGGASCNQPSPIKSMGCCGPGVLPTASPAPTPPPPGTCADCGTYPDCYAPYCNNAVCTCGCTSDSCGGGVCQPCPESCTLNLTPATANIASGGTKTLTATVVPTNGTVDQVGFVSGTSTVATVSPASDSISPYTTVATGVSGGTSTITATATMDDGTTCSDTSTVMVRSCTVSLAPSTASIGLGGTQSLTATVTPIGDTISSVGFVSGTPAVATVSPASDTTVPYDTTVTGVSNGSSTVTATATMSLGGTCFDTSVITVPACTVTLTPNPKNLYVGDTWPFTATVANISPSSVSFSSSNTGAVTVSPASDASSPYITTATAAAAGSSTLTASAILGGISRCSDTSDVTVNNANAWWQVKDGDVTTNGDIGSLIPAGSYFDEKGPGGYPGVPAYGASTNLTMANVSVTGWLANSGYNASKVYNSAYFRNALPGEVSVAKGTLKELGSTASQTDFSSALPSPVFGYYWYEYDSALNGGNNLLTISGVNLGAQKAILLVKGADVNITGDITLTKGSGFFLLVTTGNIAVAPAVGGGGGANLEGIFVTDRVFLTGTKNPSVDSRLWVRGTVVAYGGANLQRDLGVSNSSTPGEKFEFAPDLALLFPRVFGIRSMNWQEVAP